MSPLIERVTLYTRRRSLYLGWWAEYGLIIWGNLGLLFKRKSWGDLDFWVTVVCDKIVALYAIFAWVWWILHLTTPRPPDWRIWLGLVLTVLAGAVFHWAIERWGKSNERSHPSVHWTMAFVWGTTLGLFVSIFLP